MPNSQEKLWQFVRAVLASNGRCVLLVVTHHQGSSPGRAGFKMVIDSSGNMAGSIGGGIMEHKLIELSKKWLLEHTDGVKLVRQVHKAQTGHARSGMICSGEQTVAIVSLAHNSLGLINEILEGLRSIKSLAFNLSPEGISLKKQSNSSGLEFQFKNEKQWVFSEPLDQIFALHIVGGGHISLALSKLAVELDFQVTVYDHRENLPTILANRYAHDIKLTEYHKLKEFIPSGATSYVAVMTVGYRTDLEAIQSIIDGNYAYLGLLGSEAKVKQLMTQLTSTGYSHQQLSKIDAPAGLAIGSQTPTEIAVSIAGCLIRTRNAIFSKNS